MASEPVASDLSRSRRSLIRAGLAGLAGLALGALGRPGHAEAAPGGSIVMGSANSAGTTNTSLSTASTGTAFQVNQTGTGTALRGVANNGIAGFFSSGMGAGVSGVTGNNTKYGVYAANDATATSSGAALRANGKQNDGIVASTAAADTWAIRATNTNAVTGFDEGGVILALTAGATTADLPVGWPIAAGTFVGDRAVMGVTVGNESPTGVIGVSDDSTGIGVWGLATSADVSSTGIGVYGTSEGALAQAVRGDASDGGTAVYGLALQAGIGVDGRSVSGRGVSGLGTSTTGLNYGVYGRTNSADGWALYGDGRSRNYGDFAVVGTLTKSAGTFRIDHPLDPANKYLSHSFVESPDMLNVYSGTATLDGNGEATVELPAWFEALNRDVRYQLTAIGPGAPDLHVKAKVKDGRFAIGGGKARQEVCWQVTGIRKDAYATAHPTPVEEPKPAAERGLFLHPVEHGQAASKGIDAVLASKQPLREARTVDRPSRNR